ncbi:hypothetical protein DPEC_G00148970 [Dallia pectoralis]|uniref:Uncharacterized protein n=1 Tax=Dallia pectoralis TaxID=75939 RepID=A0ACC2GJ23_DALPE|nr:hypothetical protein DPEC_G00148970 [Dallia pectoralis]
MRDDRDQPKVFLPDSACLSLTAAFELLHGKPDPATLVDRNTPKAQIHSGSEERNEHSAAYTMPFTSARSVSGETNTVSYDCCIQSETRSTSTLFYCLH